ncbi:MAG: glycosyltransferase family 4 protein [Bacteroidales bacterium]|jgi:glycosyltransferase involved in cell wall biosynthesis|nr:glycosyltransferase family 4 protein [Bacteroidales bacterium]
MIIAIEAQRIFRKNKHGMDFVALESIREIQKMDTENIYYIIVQPGEDVCLESTANVHVVRLRCPSYLLWEQVALPLFLRKIKPDLLHCTSSTAPVFCKIPLVLTLHDIIFMEKRDTGNKSFYQNIGWHYRRFVLPRILPHCRKIITVSGFESQNIQEAFNVIPEEVSVVYNASSSRFKPIEHYREVSQKYIDADEYLFFLGNTDPKKNTLRTLKAYSMYVEQSEKPLPLLIADLKESAVDRILKDGNIDKNIKSLLYLPGYIKNTDLPYIYNGAKIFLYPSLRESFGIPILEAMACGTPIITSNISAIPEIAGEDAILVSPYDEAAIAGEIIRLETDPDYYQQQVDYGIERARHFSWNIIASNLIRIYQSIQ